MSHLIILPVVLPALAAVAMLLLARDSVRLHRVIGGVATALLLAVATLLVLRAAGGTVDVYRLGAWEAPYGIVLVLDRLSGLMVFLTALVALFSFLYATRGDDRKGANYHAMFQFQLMGLCGAFLTGDLFNLFVFFEVLLIASYGLLLYAGGRRRLRAGIHYVVLNLVGSALFLVGVGILYGVTGTLNMADLAIEVAAVGPESAALVRAAALVLLVVFGVKAALLPLYFWLPRTYSTATAPVAALFAIMTKVGVYVILRVYTLVFGDGAGLVAGVADPWLLPLALLTLVMGTLGAMASRRLGTLVAYLVIASVGTMLTAVALSTPDSTAAAIYYMVHSTVVLAAMFLLADLIAAQRGDVGGRLVSAPSVAQPALLGGLFLTAAVATVGLPPLSGFIGKVLVLESALDAPAAAWVYGVVLITSLLTLVALSRAGSRLFWNVIGVPEAHEEEPPTAGPEPAIWEDVAPALGLVGIVVLLAVLAGPLVDFAGATAEQLLNPADYVRAVLGDEARVGLGPIAGGGG